MTRNCGQRNTSPNLAVSLPMFNLSEVSNFNQSLFADIEKDLKLLDIEFDSITVIKWLVIVLLAIFAAIALCECGRAWFETKRYTFQNGRRSV